MTIADTNVLVDVLGAEESWLSWSTAALDEAMRNDGVVINSVIYAEISPRFADAKAVDAFLLQSELRFETLSREMLHAAGAAHRSYRRNGGEKNRMLADFLIGAHALLSGQAIITRDPKPYRTYFPTVRLITP